MERISIHADLFQEFFTDGDFCDTDESVAKYKIGVIDCLGCVNTIFFKRAIIPQLQAHFESVKSVYGSVECEECHTVHYHHFDFDGDSVIEYEHNNPNQLKLFK